MSISRTAVVLAGRYRLEDWIAAGGMGEVWAAADLVLRRRVAVKLLRAEYADHPETLDRFRAEARHAGSLSHPCIAQIYDYGEAEGAQPPFLVMELVDGPPLSRLLAAGPLDPARVMDLIAQAADGLAAAHAAGLVHRDVKPGNLLLAPGDRVKITDFGIAHAAGSAPITRTGMLIGTPAYLAPERVAGASATPGSDLYSLGVVAYECLAGAPPFAGSAMEIALAHQLRPLPPLPPAVPAAAAALVAELTAKDPAARPASAREVASRARSLREALTRAADAWPGAWQAFPPGAPGDAQNASQPGPWQESPGGAQHAIQPGGWQHLPGDAQHPTQPGGWLDHSSPTLAYAQPATLAEHPAALGDRGMLAPTGPGRRRRTLWDWTPRRRMAALAVVAAALIAGLAGVMLASGSGTASPQRHPAAHRQTTPPPHSSSAQTVQVNGSTLIGQPADAVTQRLRQLGLQVHVLTVRTGQQPPGTVVSVQPGGQVPAGSTVTVTAALAPAGHAADGHHHGDGKGKGGGGQGGD
jgi:eukaryotic-like serine/threonine-protein kinase